MRSFRIKVSAWATAGQIYLEQLSQRCCKMQTSLHSCSAESSGYAKLVVNQMRRDRTWSTGTGSVEPRSHLVLVITVVCSNKPSL